VELDKLVKSALGCEGIGKSGEETISSGSSICKAGGVIETEFEFVKLCEDVSDGDGVCV